MHHNMNPKQEQGIDRTSVHKEVITVILTGIITKIITGIITGIMIEI